MKIIAINGSPRKEGNNAKCLKIMEKEFEKQGIEFEVLQPGYRVNGCMACYHCLENNDPHCIQKNDMVNEIADKLVAADGIILASPVYYGGISGNLKSVLDRVFLCCGHLLHHKVGAALCTLRRSGGLETYQQLCAYMNSMEMVIATADYWNAVHGLEIGEVEQDTEGLEVVAKLARNMAWLVKVIHAAKGTIDPPETHKRTFTNFVR